LDAELLLYESCHALRSAITLDFYNRGRTQPRPKETRRPTMRTRRS